MANVHGGPQHGEGVLGAGGGAGIFCATGAFSEIGATTTFLDGCHDNVF